MTDRAHILLIISGSIAAFKALDIIRRMREQFALPVRVVMTKSATHFVSPLVVSALAGTKAVSDLFSLTDEAEMGHIRLGREAKAIVVAPATANMIAKMAYGLADDLAGACLLVSHAPVLIAPAMNPSMWQHPATQANVALLKQRGVVCIDPEAGGMACGEEGVGRLAETEYILARTKEMLDGDHPRQTLSQALPQALPQGLPLSGKRALVTAGPTHEAIDAVRYIGNHSSGKQGYAIAHALGRAGAEVTLISGPTALPPPTGVRMISVVSADAMHKASMDNLPTDIAICAAAVADWRVAKAKSGKHKKEDGTPIWQLTETPDILMSLAKAKPRPDLLVGFAAECESVVDKAVAKRKAKGADWMVANAIQQNPQANAKQKNTKQKNGVVFGSSHNEVWLIRETGKTHWQSMLKTEVADKLTQEIIAHFAK